MINFHNTDCMEFMASLPDNAYDLAIVDPPYGIGIIKKGVLNKNKSFSRGFKKNKQYKSKNWDSSIPTQEYFTQLKRVSKYQIIWGANYFLDFLGNTKNMIIWYKKGKDKNPNFSPVEIAWSNLNKIPGFFDYAWIGFGGINSGEKKMHPTQKPVQLYKWLLLNYAKQGDKILDTHGGSGSIAIACHELGFSLDICELDKEYFDMSVKRYNTHVSQTKLF